NNTRRLEQLMDIVLGDNQRVVMAGLPKDATSQKRVRALALQLVQRTDSGITMPNFPATLTGSAIMMQIQEGSARLATAHGILKLQDRYNYTLDQVLRFKRIKRTIGDEDQGFNLDGDRLKHFLDTVDRELGGGTELDPQIIAEIRVS